MNSKVNKTDVSWIMCTHRCDNLLFRAIDSCLNQTLKSFELIIVTNGENADKIKKIIIEKYVDHKNIFVFSTSIKYLTFSLNLALHHSAAEYVARMDADDLSSPERLIIQKNFLDKHKNIDVVGSAFAYIDENNNIYKKFKTQNMRFSNNEIKRKLFFSNPIMHPSVMFRRESVLSMGGYMGGLNAEDYDLWSRMTIEKKLNFANIDKVLLYYNIDPKNPARRSRLAYSSVASTQLRNFLLTLNFKWLLGCFYSIFKLFFHANKS